MNNKVGYVSIIGLPNVGKSTLLNSILKQKISIVTPKPQTTRKKILGILTESNFQIIFLDTPGIVKPAYLLHEKMLEEVNDSIKDADIIVLIFDVSSEVRIKESEENQIVKDLIAQKKKPIMLALNKVDSITQQQAQQLVNHYERLKQFNAVVPIAASLNFNLDRLIQEIVEHLPEGEKYYPDDIISEASERFFISEIIREKVFEIYEDEIPYSTEVIIADFKERTTGKDFISAEIIVERESQKAIIIGKGGAAIKMLGEVSRKSIEEFLQREVFLDLRVKVRKKWRNDENLLKSFGYTKKD